jgi:acetyltransferase-like isoleucine patch superfamily enzyme
LTSARADAPIDGRTSRFPMNLTTIKNLLKSWPLPRFASCGRNTVFARPRYVSIPGRISMGSDVYVGKHSSLCVVPGADGTPGEIKIGNRVWITSRLTVYAEKSVVIEDNVLIAGGVFISDASRGHSTAELPYRDQPNEDAAAITIGEGSWLGQNVVIMPGVTIGRRCIIGSNSVVTTSLPPGSVAVGAPARIVKQWDWEAKVWRKCPRPVAAACGAAATGWGELVTNTAGLVAAVA